MGQISLEKAEFYYPTTSNIVWGGNHFYNEEDCIRRCLESFKKHIPNIRLVALIDDRTTDRTAEIAKECGALVEYFKWNHSFAEAKNAWIRACVKHGSQQGDWMIVQGADFELKKIDLKWMEDRQNVIGRFLVPEYSPYLMARIILRIAINTKIFDVFNPNFLARIIPQKYQIVSRCRSLLWRYHPQIDWQNLVDEEISYCFYRVIGIGCIAGNGVSYYKMPPTIGEMIHYGFHEDGGEDGSIFMRKKLYYNLLRSIQKLANNSGLGVNSPDDRIKILNLAYNNPDWGAEVGWYKGVNILMDRIMNRDYPEGLKFFSDRFEQLHRVDHE